jgi:sugar phosphate isomerase/epimerase
LIKSAVTISLVPEARGGPFVFWDDLAEGCRKAAELGFDAVEVFPPDAGAISEGPLGRLLKDHGLRLAAVGTGAGWLKHKWTLSAYDPDVRSHAIEFVRSIIDAAGTLGAPAIVGSMQGRIEGDSYVALRPLTDALRDLSRHAERHAVPLLFEPLNRYETNIANRVSQAVNLLSKWSVPNAKVLADLFHMNIEEADVAEAIVEGGSSIGHVHLADSNRRPAGCGHTDFAPIGAALRSIDYSGYVSAEAFDYPDSEQAARHTIVAFRKHFAGT